MVTKISVSLLDQLGTELLRWYKLEEDNKNTTHEIEETPLSPAIRELIRFIEVSAGLPHELRPDEQRYRAHMVADPEQLSCFRDRDETYRRLVSSFELQSARDDPAFCAVDDVAVVYMAQP
jgi:hypothetical protein